MQSLLQNQTFAKSNSHSRILFQHVHSTQEGQGQRPVIKLKHFNRYVKSENFKLEGLPPVEERLDGKEGPQRCLLYGPNNSSVPPSPPLQDAEQIFPVQLSPIWAVHSPMAKGIHQAPQASCRHA